MCLRKVDIFSCSNDFYKSCYCENCTKIQDCRDIEQKQIYSYNLPERKWQDFGGYLESELKCSGMCQLCLGKSFYSGDTQAYIYYFIIYRTNTLTCDKAINDWMEGKYCLLYVSY